MESMTRQETYRQAGDCQETLEQQIKMLFEVSADSTSPEKRLEVLTAALAHAFLRVTQTNSEIGLADLAAKFKDTEIPIHPKDPLEYVNSLAGEIVAHAVRTSSPRFIGHMTSALPYFLRPLAGLIAAMNQNMVKVETAKSLTFYERSALAMIHRLVYRFSDDFYERHVQSPGSTLGILVSGGTVANITALWCARNLSLGSAEGFLGVEQEGLARALKHYGYDGAVIIGSALMHYSFEKAATLLGMGAVSVVRVPTDARNRVDLVKLREVLSDCRTQNLAIIAMIGVAGSTDCGSIDPLNEIAEIAAEAKVHFHVDAAWGGAFLLSNASRARLDGIQFADSVTIDGHKQLYLPVGLGMLLLRDAEAAMSMEKQARYILRPGSMDLGKRSLEGSRPAAVIFLHSALNIIGQRGYEFLLDEALRKVAYMVGAIRSRLEFELLEDPDLNILVYRFLPAGYRRKSALGMLTDADNAFINDFNRRLQKAQRKIGNSFVSRTTLDLSARRITLPIVALRAVIANPLTTESDIDAVLDEQASIAATLEQEA